MRKMHFLSTLLISLFLSTILVSGLISPDNTFAEIDNRQDMTKKTPSYRSRTQTYGRVELSIINFEAVDVPNGSAGALGINLKGGVRLTEIVSLEAGLNWIIVPDFPLPIPLSWMPGDDGLYMNLGAGLRFNLAGYHSNRTVPWISIWRVGHAVLSDFSVGGTGSSYSLGIESMTDKGKRWLLSLTLHEFSGNLEIYDVRDYSFEYEDTDIRAVELNIAVSMK